MKGAARSGPRQMVLALLLTYSVTDFAMAGMMGMMQGMMGGGGGMPGGMQSMMKNMRPGQSKRNIQLLS